MPSEVEAPMMPAIFHRMRAMLKSLGTTRWCQAAATQRLGIFDGAFRRQWLPAPAVYFLLRKDAEQVLDGGGLEKMMVESRLPCARDVFGGAVAGQCDQGDVLSP